MNFDKDVKALESLLTTGGFLCAGDNIMTISWGMIGVLWRKKVMLVVVRKSRYTHEIIEQNKEFAVCVPKSGTMKEEIAICGKESGRNGDKFAKASLKKQNAKSINCVVPYGCEKYYECKVITKLSMGDCDLSQIGAFYADGDMHDFYFAEIVDQYNG